MAGDATNYEASAELIKSHNPLTEVALRDMKTGEITPVSYKPGII